MKKVFSQVKKLSDQHGSSLAGRLLISLVLLLTFSFQAFISLASAGPLAEIMERRRTVAGMMEAATVCIVVDGESSVGVGTGFVVGNGYIVTSAHVTNALGRRGTLYVLNGVIPARKATLVNSIYERKKDDNISGRDLALLRFIPPMGVELPILSFNLDFMHMDRVSAWGYPAVAAQFRIDLELLRRGDTGNLRPPQVTCTQGTIDALAHDRLGSSILHSATTAEGNSGGPLVNSRGEVVGMNTWGYIDDVEGAELSGAQLAEEVASFLSSNRVTPRLAPGQQLASSQPRRETPAVSSGRMKLEVQKDRRRNFRGIGVAVPQGWSVIDEEHNMIIVGADDDTATVGVVQLKGQSLRQVALDLHMELKGTAPELVDDVYMFTFSENGFDSRAFVGEGYDKGWYVFLFISGDVGNPGVDEVLESLEQRL